MTDHDDIDEIVEIDFEVGHTSVIRTEPTDHDPPRTHDWTVYVRSSDVHGDLKCLIKRCVFYLHPEFPDWKREVKSTPFAIRETGYAGFHLPIDIFFKTKKEPKKFRIEYDLDLHMNIEGHPPRQKESSIRRYRCSFHNPDPDLRQKLLAAGGKVRDLTSTSMQNHDRDESDSKEHQSSPSSDPIIRHSPAIKRTHSPPPTINHPNNKKVKTDLPIINPKKKTQQSMIKHEASTKSTINSGNNKKVQVPSSTTKLLSNGDEKSTKNVAIKDSNHLVASTSNTNGMSESRPLSKSKIDHDVKPSTQSTVNMNIKKKEPIPSPSKANATVLLKKPTNLPINKSSQKTSANKTEQTLTIKSPSSVPLKRESSPNIISSNSTTSTGLISSLKKIPRKVVPPPPPPPPPLTSSKRVRSPMTPPPSNKNSDRDSRRSQSSSSKSQPSSKRDHSSTTISSSSSTNNANSSRNSTSSNRSGKHNSSSSTTRDRTRSRSRSRSRSHNRSNHQTHHNNRSNHSSRHSSQQKERSNKRTSPHSHSSSTSKQTSSYNHSRRTPTPSKSIRSPSRSTQCQNEPIHIPSNDIPILPSTTSFNTPPSQSDSVELSTAVSTTCSPSAQAFQHEDDHTQAAMDIDGHSDDDVNIRRQNSHSQDQISPLSSIFIASNVSKSLTNQNNSHSDHSYSLSDTNETNDDCRLSTDGEDDDEVDDDDNIEDMNMNNDLFTVLNDENLRTKLIYIYNRFTLNSPNDLSVFVSFFKRHQLFNTSTKTTNGMFTYDLFSLNPLLIHELAADLGYKTNSIVNRTEQ